MDFAVYTNQGRRDNNEDSCSIARYLDSFCFVVADGLGGHGGGEVASAAAVDAVCALFSEEGFSDTFFADAFDRAQQAIFAEQRKSYAVSQAKTTLVILVVHQDLIYWAHVGDSRMYYLKNNKIKLRTLDHSVPQVMASSGMIKESEIRKHPDRSHLLHVMGTRGEKPCFETGGPLPLTANQAFLLCTDGYWELIEDKDIQNCLKASANGRDWLNRMNTIIVENGQGTDMDNFTGLAVLTERKSLFGASNG